MKGMDREALRLHSMTLTSLSLQMNWMLNGPASGWHMTLGWDRQEIRANSVEEAQIKLTQRSYESDENKKYRAQCT